MAELKDLLGYTIRIWINALRYEKFESSNNINARDVKKAKKIEIIIENRSTTR